MNWRLGALTHTPHLRILCPRNSLKHKDIGLTGHQLQLPHLDQNQLLVLSSTHFIFQERRKTLCSELYSSIKHVHSSATQRGFLHVAPQLMFSCSRCWIFASPTWWLWHLFCLVPVLFALSFHSFFLPHSYMMQLIQHWHLWFIQARHHPISTNYLSTILLTHAASIPFCVLAANRV